MTGAVCRRTQGLNPLECVTQSFGSRLQRYGSTDIRREGSLNKFSLFFSNVCICFLVTWNSCRRSLFDQLGEVRSLSVVPGSFVCAYTLPRRSRLCALCAGETCDALSTRELNIRGFPKHAPAAIRFAFSLVLLLCFPLREEAAAGRGALHVVALVNTGLACSSPLGMVGRRVSYGCAARAR